jgi:hypothetical protein
VCVCVRLSVCVSVPRREKHSRYDLSDLVPTKATDLLPSLSCRPLSPSCAYEHRYRPSKPPDTHKRHVAYAAADNDDDGRKGIQNRHPCAYATPVPLHLTLQYKTSPSRRFHTTNTHVLLSPCVCVSSSEPWPVIPRQGRT